MNEKKTEYIRNMMYERPQKNDLGPNERANDERPSEPDLERMNERPMLMERTVNDRPRERNVNDRAGADGMQIPCQDDMRIGHVSHANKCIVALAH